MGSKLLIKFTCIILACQFSTLGFAQDAETEGEANGWSLKRDKDGIQVFTRDVEDSKFDEVRGVMVIEARLESVVALIRDGEACPDWADLCEESIILEEVSETEYYGYNLNDVPWPVSDRDAITHVTWWQDPDTKTVMMKAQAIESDRVPKRRGALRMEDSVTGWEFTQLEDDLLQVVSTGHIDPAGPTPAWVTNMMLVDSPFKTMEGLREIMETDNYADIEFEFIQ